MKIKILVKKIREEKNMTLEELSKKSGISKGNLSKIENQEIDPKISTLIQISKALEVELEKLYESGKNIYENKK